MSRQKLAGALLATGLGILLIFPAKTFADQSTGRVITSVVNNPTTIITPPVDTNPPGDTTVISGGSAPSTPLKIINNGRVVAHTQTGQDGQFTVTVPLQDGRNVISAQKPSGQTSKPITITRTPTWWRKWGKPITYLVSGLAAVGILVFLGHYWLAARSKIIPFDNDDLQPPGNKDDQE